MFFSILIVDDCDDGDEDGDDEFAEPIETCWPLEPTGRDEITFDDGPEGDDSVEP